MEGVTSQSLLSSPCIRPCIGNKLAVSCTKLVEKLEARKKKHVIDYAMLGVGNYRVDFFFSQRLISEVARSIVTVL